MTGSSFLPCQVFLFLSILWSSCWYIGSFSLENCFFTWYYILLHIPLSYYFHSLEGVGYVRETAAGHMLLQPCLRESFLLLLHMIRHYMSISYCWRIFMSFSSFHCLHCPPSASSASFSRNIFILLPHTAITLFSSLAHTFLPPSLPSFLFLLLWGRKVVVLFIAFFTSSHFSLFFTINYFIALYTFFQDTLFSAPHVTNRHQNRDKESRRRRRERERGDMRETYQHGSRLPQRSGRW